MLVLLATLGFELGYHRDLSWRASDRFSRDAQRLITNANLSVDIRTITALLLRRKRHPLFRAHFDDCFDLGDHLVRWQETEERLRGTPELGSDRAAVKELGRRLGSTHHSGQDFYAHSNHVEHLELSGVAMDATHEEATIEPGLESVRNRWRTDGLMSGAYFEEPPDVDGMELHHRTMNKDSPALSTDYRYAGRLDRTDMHRRALACAARETERLNDIAQACHPDAFLALATYRSSVLERAFERIKYWFAWGAATVSGHWR